VEKKRLRLPARLRKFFWDVDFERLTGGVSRDFILKRLLACGDWSAWKWLRKHVPEDELRALLVRTRGRSLEPDRLLFYAVILGIPYETAVAWLREREDPWSRRHEATRKRST